MTAAPITADPMIDADMEVFEEEFTKEDFGWSCVVFNDHINLVEHVVRIFRKVLKVSKERAEMLTMQVHIEGKSIVKSGSYDECFNVTAELLKYSLHASLIRN